MSRFRDFRESGGNNKAQYNVFRQRCRGRGQGARREITCVELELHGTAVHNDIGEGQPSVEKTLQQTALEMGEGQNVAPKQVLKVEGTDISQNLEDGRRELSLGMVAIVALTQVWKATSGFKTK